MLRSKGPQSSSQMIKILFPLSYRGPEGTPFEGGVFVTELIFPTDYPLSPPKMKFTSEMFHPNGEPHPLLVGFEP